MAEFSLVVKNAHIVTAEKEFGGSIAVDGERIVALAAGSVGRGEVEIDAGGRPVIPGIVDPHTHLGLFYPYADDCFTESAAAARGGVTTMLQFIRSLESYHASFPAKRDEALANFQVDFGFHFGVQSIQHIEELGEYADRYGVRSHKMYFGYGQDNPLGIIGAHDGWLWDALRALAGIDGGWLCIHAENFHVLTSITEEVRLSGRNDLAAWSEARPPFVESSEVYKAIAFAEATRGPLYVVHTTVGADVEGLYLDAARRGARLSLETCPQYLIFDNASHPAGIKAKILPPIRSAEHVEGLWRGIRKRYITTVGSDHVPNPPERKPGLDVWNEIMGFMGVEAMLPILIQEGHLKRGIPLGRIVEVSSSNPARLFGLYPRKGTISVGSDADLVILDLEAERAVASRDKGVNVYEGVPLRGWPTHTISRGRVAMMDGAVQGARGWGECVNDRLIPD
jgi:dihydroorotase-like cyclic amidohydrolase